MRFLTIQCKYWWRTWYLWFLTPQCNLDPPHSWVHSLVTCPLRPRFPIDLLCVPPWSVLWTSSPGCLVACRQCLRTLDRTEEQSSSFLPFFYTYSCFWTSPCIPGSVPTSLVTPWVCFVHVSPRCGCTQRLSEVGPAIRSVFGGVCKAS